MLAVARPQDLRRWPAADTAAHTAGPGVHAAWAWFVGVNVCPGEPGELAVQMIKKIFDIHGAVSAPTVVHADRGTSMNTKAVAAPLSDWEVDTSHPRPRGSDDNPLNTVWCKTLEIRAGVRGNRSAPSAKREP